MIILFGEKQKGKSTETVILKGADYVKWVIDNKNATGSLLAVQNDFIRLIELFDAKPLQKKCFKCKSQATRFSFYQGNIDPYFWCDKCDPFIQGAMPGKLSIITKYRQALRFVESTCEKRVADYRGIIKNMSNAKGLPQRITGKQAELFFK